MLHDCIVDALTLCFKSRCVLFSGPAAPLKGGLTHPHCKSVMLSDTRTQLGTRTQVYVLFGYTHVRTELQTSPCQEGELRAVALEVIVSKHRLQKQSLLKTKQQQNMSLLQKCVIRVRSLTDGLLLRL